MLLWRSTLSLLVALLRPCRAEPSFLVVPVNKPITCCNHLTSPSQKFGQDGPLTRVCGPRLFCALPPQHAAIAAVLEMHVHTVVAAVLEMHCALISRQFSVDPTSPPSLVPLRAASSCKQSAPDSEDWLWNSGSCGGADSFGGANSCGTGGDFQGRACLTFMRKSREKEKIKFYLMTNTAGAGCGVRGACLGICGLPYADADLRDLCEAVPTPCPFKHATVRQLGGNKAVLVWLGVHHGKQIFALHGK